VGPGNVAGLHGGADRVAHTVGEKGPKGRSGPERLLFDVAAELENNDMGLSKKKVEPGTKPTFGAPTVNEEIIAHKEKSKKTKQGAAWKAKYTQLLEAVVNGHGDGPWPVPAHVEPKKAKPTAKPVVVVPEQEKESTRSSKVTALAKKFTGTKGEDFQSWSRTARIWRSKHPDVDDAKMGAQLMESVTDAAETQVYAVLDEGDETFYEVLKALSMAFGKGEMPEATKHIDAFERFRRGKKSMRDYLVEFQVLLSRAQKCGYNLCKMSGGNSLLRNAELSAANAASILSQVKEAQRADKSLPQSALPPFQLVWEKLDVLAQAYEASDEAQAAKKSYVAALTGKGGKDDEKVEAQTRYAKAQSFPGKGQQEGWKKGKKGKGKGKGDKGGKGKKGGKGGGKGKSGKGKGGGKGKGVQVCWHYQKEGWCWYGDECKYEHGEEKPNKKKRFAMSEDPGGEGPAGKKPKTE